MVHGLLTLEKTDWCRTYDEKFKRPFIYFLRKSLERYHAKIEDKGDEILLFYNNRLDPQELSRILNEYGQFVKQKNGKI